MSERVPADAEALFYMYAGRVRTGGPNVKLEELVAEQFAKLRKPVYEYLTATDLRVIGQKRNPLTGGTLILRPELHQVGLTSRVPLFDLFLYSAASVAVVAASRLLLFQLVV